LLRDAEFASMKFAPQFYLSGFVKQILKPRNLRPVAPPKRNFPQRAGAKGNRKIPWSVLLFGLHAMASDPPRMLTQSGNDCQRLAAIFSICRFSAGRLDSSRCSSAIFPT